MTLQTQVEPSPRGPTVHRWAVILAGGDGTRLLPLTRRLSGDERPKQFCPVVGDDTLLAQTLKRVEKVVSPNQTISIVTKAHQRFYREPNSGACGAGLLVQPLNRGTGPAILYSLMNLLHQDPRAVVGFFPSDHYFTDDEAFSDCVCQAYESAELHSGAVILLGITPTHPETGYGWIEPGVPFSASGSSPVLGVRRFWEKPSSAVSDELIRRGCLWNSFIMVGQVSSFLRLTEKAVPNLFRSFESVVPACFTLDEETSMLDLYLSLPSSSFCADVLSVSPGVLGVLPTSRLEWTDVGDVGRALSLLRREGLGLPPRRIASREAAKGSIAATAS